MGSIERRVLGRTGLPVSVLGYGAMDLGGPPATHDISDKQAEQVLNAVLDNGINFIDTAVCYGASERRIGHAISRRRGEFILASKCGCVPDQPLGSPHIHTRSNIRAGVEHSLRTMGTDYLDVAQLHIGLTRHEWEAEGALEELIALKKAGSIRFIGISGILPNLTEQVDSGVFDVFQIPYSALEREHEKIISKASASGAGIVIRGGMARGLPDDWERRDHMLNGAWLRLRWDNARLDELLGGMSRTEFMLRYAISEPALDTVIVGTKKLDHLLSNVAAARKGPLSPDLIAEARRRLDQSGSQPLPI
jgi:aryl-alcohol dehydrogenase-like predicted oxidoreductase